MDWERIKILNSKGMACNKETRLKFAHSVEMDEEVSIQCCCL